MNHNLNDVLAHGASPGLCRCVDRFNYRLIYQDRENDFVCTIGLSMPKYWKGTYDKLAVVNSCCLVVVKGHLSLLPPKDQHNLLIRELRLKSHLGLPIQTLRKVYPS